jgi:hypothetical protein
LSLKPRDLETHHLIGPQIDFQTAFNNRRQTYGAQSLMLEVDKKHAVRNVLRFGRD